MSAAAAASPPSDARIRYYRCHSDVSADRALESSLVSPSKSVLRADKSTRVLTRYQQGTHDFTFLRMPLSDLKGKTAFDVWVAGKGRFYVFSCLACGEKQDKLRLNLESYGAYPEEGAAPDKLINVLSPKMWPMEIAQ